MEQKAQTIVEEEFEVEKLAAVLRQVGETLRQTSGTKSKSGLTFTEFKAHRRSAARAHGVH